MFAVLKEEVADAGKREDCGGVQSSLYDSSLW